LSSDETNESLDVVDNQLVRSNRNPITPRSSITSSGSSTPSRAPAASSICRGWNAGARRRNLDGQIPPRRDAGDRRGGDADPDTIDRIKTFWRSLKQRRPSRKGSDDDLISQLHHMAENGTQSAPAIADAPPDADEPAPQAVTQGTLVPQVLERPLRPGEVSLDELERAFRETPTEVTPTEVTPSVAPSVASPPSAAAPAQAAAKPQPQSPLP